MGDRLDEMGDAEVVLVTFGSQRSLRGFRSRLGLPMQVLADEDRGAYRAYGLRRGPWWRVWGLATVRRYARLLAGGRRIGRPGGGTLQLGGDVAGGREGRLVYVFRSRGPADRPAVADLVAAVRRS